MSQNEDPTSNHGTSGQDARNGDAPSALCDGGHALWYAGDLCVLSWNALAVCWISSSNCSDHLHRATDSSRAHPSFAMAGSFASPVYFGMAECGRLSGCGFACCG